jgi:hypothetical protein
LTDKTDKEPFVQFKSEIKKAKKGTKRKADEVEDGSAVKKVKADA